MKLIKTTLKNGLRVVKVPMQGTETVTAIVLVGTGSKHEKKETSGLSHFLEHMMFKGTKKRPSTKILTEILDRVGGVYNAFTGEEYTGYWIKVDSSHSDLALDVLSDMLLNSKIPSGEIEREKGVILEEIKMYQDRPMDYVGELWEKLLYGNQPAGWPIIGNKKTVTSFKRKDFVKYFGDQYKAENMVVVLAGNVGKLNVEKYFGSVKSGEFGGKPEVKVNQKKPGVLVYKKAVDQTHLIVGFRAYNLFHKDRYALTLLASILGGMMSSRIWLSVRERQGLAYSVRTMADMSTDCGSLLTQAGVGHSKVEQAVSAIMKEYKKIRDKKVSKSELDKAKENLRGKLLIGMEASDAVATSFAMQEVLTGKLVTPKQIINRVNKVTPSDIQRVARDVFKEDGLNLCMITNEERGNLDKLLKV